MKFDLRHNDGKNGKLRLVSLSLFLLRNLTLVSFAKVLWVDGAVAPGKPPAAAHD